MNLVALRVPRVQLNCQNADVRVKLIQDGWTCGQDQGILLTIDIIPNLAAAREILSADQSLTLVDVNALTTARYRLLFSDDLGSIVFNLLDNHALRDYVWIVRGIPEVALPATVAQAYPIPILNHARRTEETVLGVLEEDRRINEELRLRAIHSESERRQRSRDREATRHNIIEARSTTAM